MAFSSGSTPPLTPHLSPSNVSSTLHIHSSPSSRESTPELTPEQERARRRAIVQPAYFYPNSGAWDPAHDPPHPSPNDEESPIDEDAAADALLDPAEDPRATRGIPVFRPTVDEFADFERYMEGIEPWGRRSGIVKVIPPKEWTAGLSSTTSRLSGVKLRNPIEQHMIGRTGLYRQQNEERRHTYSVRDWAGLCARDGLRAPTPRDIVQQELNARRSRRARKGEDNVEDDEERKALADALRKIDERGSGTHNANSTSAHATDSEFYDALDPRAEWLPENTVPDDYTPAVCRALERHFWRNCGLGKDPMYGADMQGTLFDPEMKTWNVACLPSVLERLLPGGEKIPGVNTPYLYFGMWRATFAWHVEDMDLYSINYIHWGAPKYWYAIPSQRSEAFEDTMRKHFATEAAECPQFMRHKSFLASPAILAEADCRPNTLVQHQGEFVITYPRGYHAGFNVGLNCAESVNFALESWIELGRRAQFCKCVSDSVRLDVDAILSKREARNPLDLSVDDYPPAFSSKKRKTPPMDDPIAKRPRPEPGVKYATAAELERLPTIKIRIKPLKRPSTSPYRARTQPVTQNLPHLSSPTAFRGNDTSRETSTSPRNKSTSSSGSSLPRLRIPVQSPSPCCLCSAVDSRGLLPVREPSSPGGESSSPRRASTGGQPLGSLRVHEACAQAIPETWVAEIGGQKYVCGVEKIVKDRWALKCSLCTKTTSKTHGAKIQCAKGRCPKAFHVPCARDNQDVEFTSIEGEDNSDTKSEGRRLKKPKVTALCPQHNPRLVEARKADKQQKLDADIGALTQYSRIKVRASGGVFAVTLVNVYEDRRTVEVIWDQGSTKEFRYTSVVWTDDGDVQEKPSTGFGGVGEGSDSNRPRPSPAPAPSDVRNATASTSQLGPQARLPQTSSANPSVPGYTYQSYPYFAYPPPYSSSPPADTSSSQAQSPAQPAPQQFQPPQPHHAYTVPMPVPMPYPYSYGGYNTQHGYTTQPQFYPAHGYHYPPITTYHPAGLPPSGGAGSTTSTSTGVPPATNAPAPGSEGSNPQSAASGSDSSSSHRTVQSYVGVRPANSQDILSGTHHARTLPTRT